MATLLVCHFVASYIEEHSKFFENYKVRPAHVFLALVVGAAASTFANWRTVEVRRRSSLPRLVSAQYGANQNWCDALDVLQRAIRSGRSTITITNAKMGGDPAPDVVKVLHVVSTHGKLVENHFIRESDELDLSAWIPK
jgi:hypothetical protein